MKRACLQGPLRLDADIIQRKLSSRYVGRSLLVVEECSSTNDLAAEKAERSATNGFTVIAEKQTAGRGREGRQWSSPPGGIWMTTLIRPHDFEEVSALPLIGALATSMATNFTLKLDSRVRWPNDVILNDRKLAGVIAETKVRGSEPIYVLLGVGVNANFQVSRTDSIREIAISLSDILGRTICREDLIASILNETEELYNLLRSGKRDRILSILGKFDCSRGTKVRVKLGDRDLAGVFGDYETLTKVRIVTTQGFETVDTGTVVSVEYKSN